MSEDDRAFQEAVSALTELVLEMDKASVELARAYLHEAEVVAKRVDDHIIARIVANMRETLGQKLSSPISTTAMPVTVGRAARDRQTRFGDYFEDFPY